MRRRTVGILVVMLLAMSLPAVAYGGHHGWVVVAPPSPRVEIVPQVPYPHAVWAPGYWEWRDGRHVWIGGHYRHHRRGYVWAPRVWVHHGHGWHHRHGHWHRVP